MAEEKEFKTGFSTSLRITTMQQLDEFSKILNLKRADVGRKIIEYFIEHNDVEDLKE